MEGKDTPRPSTGSAGARIIVWLIMLPGGAALALWSDLHYFRDFLLSPAFHLATLVPGLGLLMGVLTISRHTGRTLARYGRIGDLPRFETNRLVIEGPYSCMRHPMHFGLLFFPLAVALLLGSVTFILFLAPAEILFMLVMIRTFEEAEAVRKFGQAYLDYRARVPAFSLRPDCLRKLFSSPAGMTEPLSPLQREFRHETPPGGGRRP